MCTGHSCSRGVQATTAVRSHTLHHILRPSEDEAAQGGGGVCQNTAALYHTLLCWRHISATVGHLEVTKMYIEEKYTPKDEASCLDTIRLALRLHLHCTKLQFHDFCGNGGSKVAP